MYPNYFSRYFVWFLQSTVPIDLQRKNMIQTLQHVWMSAKIQMSKAVFGTAQVSRDRMSPEIDSK